MTKYKSKIGWGIVALLALILGTEAAISIFNKHWNGLLILLLVTIFVVYVFLSIHYLVGENDLIVKSAFGMKTTVNINSIKKITETDNPLSSPATSLDRIEVFYGKQSIIISPKRKTEFINHLLSINPRIEVIYKAK
jgi:Protein of unknown function (DUF1200).